MKRKLLKNLELNSPPYSPQTSNSDISANTSRERGRKQVRRDRAKAYRDVKQLKVKLLLKERNSEKHKKKYYRLKHQLVKSSNSPRAITKQFTAGEK